MIDHTVAETVPITLTPVNPSQIVEGTPLTGHVSLGVFAGQEYGVWQMTPGVMTDVEDDELFVVLWGEATVTLEDDGSVIELGPGSVARLAQGMRTTWSVTETLRKVYVAR
jgi:uncharacterized cupin superfamily protein